VLTDAEARAEIGNSKAILENGLGHEVSSFAYPYGFHGRQCADWSSRLAVLLLGFGAIDALRILH